MPPASAAVRSLSRQVRGQHLEFSYPVVGAGQRHQGSSDMGGRTSGGCCRLHRCWPRPTRFRWVSRRTVYARTGGYISLSRDGHTLYTNNYLESGETVINKLSLDPIGAPTPVFTSAPDALTFPGTFSVNGDETLIFADYANYSGNPILSQQVWIPLDGSNTYNVIDERERQYGELNPQPIHGRVALRTRRVPPRVAPATVWSPRTSAGIQCTRCSQPT